MGKVAALCVLVSLAGCSMYGGKPEKLRNPGTVPGPKAEPVAKPEYIETCPVDFQKIPPKAGVKRDANAANTAVASADVTIASASKTPEQTKREELFRNSIEEYKAALGRDPYSAHATLHLAVAYDRVYRKGCALALLKRLVSLTANPTYEPDATADLARIDDNREWFKDYRQEALKAIGH